MLLASLLGRCSVGRLAIVIPSVGSVETLEATLLSVLENRPQCCEVVVVHSHAYDDPYQLEGEVRLIKAPARSTLVACANLGFRETSADVVHLLTAGCQVQEGWTEGVLKHFADPRVAVVAPMVLDEDEPSHVLSAAIGYGAGGIRRATTHCAADLLEAGVAPILAASIVAVFYNRLTLSTVGYLSAEVGAEFADVDLGLLLRHAGFKSIIDPRLRVRAPNRPLEKVGAFRRALQAERLFWRNAPLVGWIKSLAAHPLAILADAANHAASLPSYLAGRAVGAAMVGAARRHHQRLFDLHNAAPVPAREALGRQLRVDMPHQKAAKGAKEQARVA